MLGEPRLTTECIITLLHISLTVFGYKGVVSRREAEEGSPDLVHVVVVGGCAVVVLEAGVAKHGRSEPRVKLGHSFGLQGIVT